jgi:hypothetical protein
MLIDEHWAIEYRNDEMGTVRKLTDQLANALLNVTLNAPDWNTLRFVQTARRLYKPKTADLTPGQYVELNRRFVESYAAVADKPELLVFRKDVENYQARLDMLGLKDYQLRSPVSLRHAFRKVFLRSLKMLLLLPAAIPGALLHLPVGWIAATVGERFSYEMDDIATLKVFATIALLPLLYIAIAVFVGLNYGVWWALLTLTLLPLSFVATVKIVEAETSLLVSILSVLRLARLSSEVEDLRITRADLVEQTRLLVERMVDPNTPRMFTKDDFNATKD